MTEQEESELIKTKLWVLSLTDRCAELREKNDALCKLVRDMHAAYVQAIDWYEQSETTVIGEFSCNIAEEEAELKSLCDSLRTQYVERMQELGIEVGE